MVLGGWRSVWGGGWRECGSGRWGCGCVVGWDGGVVCECGGYSVWVGWCYKILVSRGGDPPPPPPHLLIYGPWVVQYSALFVI